MKRFFFFLVAFVAVNFVLAQTPEAFNYQAILRDVNGMPIVSTAKTIIINILQGGASGTSVYQETHSITTTAQGAINFIIGNGAVNSGSFSTIDWGTSAYWIKVTVDDTEISNGQLLSVPYALYSKGSADSSQWIGTGNNIFYNSGNVGIGTSSPNGKMIVQGDNTTPNTEPLFEVRRQDGLPVFQVYNEGIRIFTAKGVKSNNAGVVIADRDNQKGIHNYFEANSDSTRIYFTPSTKGGGSVVIADRDNQKGNTQLFRVTTDSTRVYVNGDDKKGFGVIDKSSTTQNNIVNLTSNNYLIGHESGKSISTGIYNSVIGYQSGKSLTTGFRNVFLGYQSGMSTTVGDRNVFIGEFVGTNNINGYRNVAIGSEAFTSNTSGLQNVAIGNLALNKNTTGKYNIAMGYLALYKNIDGGYNSAVGNGALNDNTTGDQNTALGLYALRTNTTGSCNVAVGMDALPNLTGSYNTAVGYKAFYINYQVGNFNNSMALGCSTIVSASNQIRMGNANITSIGGQVDWTTLSDSRVKTDVQENVSGLAFIKLLRPVTYNYNLDKEYELLGVKDSGSWEGKGDIETMRFSGFLAQDVYDASQKCGFEFGGVDKPKDNKGLWGLRYAEFTVPLVKAVQEQQVLIEEQQQTILKQQQINQNQSELIELLTKRIEALEKAR